MRRVASHESRVADLPDGEVPPVPLDRRDALKLLVTAPLALSFGLSLAGCDRAARSARRVADTAGFRPAFFTDHELETVRILVDLIIPRDKRSGSATEAKVPEFMDFMMADRDTKPEGRSAMRDGLAWVDQESRRRFSRSFVQSSDRQRTALLDDIAWPARARPEMQPGVTFFNSFR
ncbi:MAG TPA: gluconate 2-dehydrogenase subunit 3 family protein, partial [Gemmatimonadales bacterium]|nr:gluconate 2-dehydrogenase subunit 3 family protein [Gemmatimonadales bacterium]